MVTIAIGSNELERKFILQQKHFISVTYHLKSKSQLKFAN